jgi:hypothetical protein
MTYMFKFNRSVVKGVVKLVHAELRQSKLENQASIKSAAIKLFKRPEKESIESAIRSSNTSCSYTPVSSKPRNSGNFVDSQLERQLGLYPLAEIFLDLLLRRVLVSVLEV